jgi:hypothetical protein
MVPTTTWERVTGCTPSHRSVSSWAWTKTQPQTASERTVHAQSTAVMRGLGFFSRAGKSRNARGSRKRR